MLYGSASNQRLPCLYICPVANVLGRAPLIPCFIGCNRSGQGTVVGTHLQPCGAAPNLPAALARPPHPPR